MCAVRCPVAGGRRGGVSGRRYDYYNDDDYYNYEYCGLGLEHACSGNRMQSHMNMMMVWAMDALVIGHSRT